jgi:hypothetical protein
MITLRRSANIKKAVSVDDYELPEELFQAIELLQRHLHHKDIKVAAASDFSTRLLTWKAQNKNRRINTVIESRLIEADLYVQLWLNHKSRLIYSYVNKATKCVVASPDTISNKMRDIAYGVIFNYNRHKSPLALYLSRSLALKSRDMFTLAEAPSLGLHEVAFVASFGADAESLVEQQPYTNLDSVLIECSNGEISAAADLPSDLKHKDTTFDWQSLRQSLRTYVEC